MLTARRTIMASQKLSENQINIRIVPKRVRWPEASFATTWAMAHGCVDALQELVRNVDADCLQVEQNKDLSASAIRRHRSEICDKAMAKLASFQRFDVAEKAMVDNIDLLERLSDPDPQRAQVRDKLKEALRDLREGVEATRRLAQERCKVRERLSV
jgi:hypothetical protein